MSERQDVCDAIAARWVALTADQRLAVAQVDDWLYTRLDALAAASRFAFNIDD